MFLKGLLSKFDYLAFAKENDCPAVATDVWGQEHDLIAEDIQVVFTESQLKLWSYYDSWDDYKNKWHENNCYLCRTNYEEDNIPDSEWNYQMIQTLLDMTDEELDEIIKKDYDEIDNIDNNVKTQLKAFGCYNGREKTALQKCLLAYPPLLRDGYCREQLKDIKKSKIFDGKAGRLHIRNKRLFAVPDPYAAFERIFLHIEEPEGLLKFGEICTNEPSYNNVEEVDLLRSPHLHIEHATRKLNKDPKVHKWLTTKAVYTSFKDIASRILQFDFDGDQLNLVAEPAVISAAKRTIENHGIVPLFYDAQKAGKQKFTPENRYQALMMAHNFGGAAIGGVSNTLTKLWNSTQDCAMASRICCMNNLIIDAAKTGKIIPYPPDIGKPINQVSKSRLPWFFKFTYNGRSGNVKCLNKPEKGSNISIMNKMAMRFEPLDKQHINPIYKDEDGRLIDDFNPYMLMSGPVEENQEIADEFNRMLNTVSKIRHDMKQKAIRSFENERDELESDRIWWAKKWAEVKATLVEKYKDEELIYNNLVLNMFVDPIFKNLRCGQHSYAGQKESFWYMYGDKAFEVLNKNLTNSHRCTKDDCNMVIPDWDKNHNEHHQGKDETHKKCPECGKIFNVFVQRVVWCPDCSLLGTFNARKATIEKSWNRRIESARARKNTEAVKELTAARDEEIRKLYTNIVVKGKKNA